MDNPAASCPAVDLALQGVERDYPEALVRFASLRADKLQHLLFGWIELYPFDMKAPSGWDAGVKPWNVPETSGWTCAFSARRMPTADALRWYTDAAATGTVVIKPDQNKPIRSESLRLAPEPAWGRLASGVGAPFILRWHDGPRVHRLVPMCRPRRPVWGLGKVDAARAWLKDNLGFDPYAHEEWLCGLALLAPDPVCASVRLFRSARTAAGEETLSMEIVPRRTAERTADLTTLTVHVAERRCGAWTTMVSRPVPSDGFATLTMPQPTAEICWALVCRDRGPLRVSEPGYWIDQVSIDMAMGGAKATVEVPSRGRRKPAQSYDVVHRTSTLSSVGAPVDDAGRKHLQRLVARRRDRERRAEAPQRVFGLVPSNSPPTMAEVEAKKREAQDFVAGLVQRARHRVTFVDPYFGMGETRLFALRNEHEGVVVRVLTGLPALKALAGAAQGFQIQHGLAFATDLKNLETKLGPRTPAVRIMQGGDQPVIHDRYLLLDDEVWQCGPSFNEIGERLGVMMRLPNPIDVRVMIARVWLRSRPLAEAAASPGAAT